MKKTLILLLMLLLLYFVGKIPTERDEYINNGYSPSILLNVSNKLVKDPYVIKENGIYNMFFTFGDNPWDADIGYAKSNDGIHWVFNSTLLRHSQAWRQDISPIWAPFVIKKGKKYFLYVSGVVNGYKMGYFTSNSLNGHWKWSGYVKDNHGNNLKGIDPSIVRYRGTYYYVCSGAKDNQINLYQSHTLNKWVPVGTILTITKRWEGKILEAPKLLIKKNEYFLFYGANNSDTNQRIGVAVSRKIDGPYHKIKRAKLNYPGWGQGAISHPGLIRKQNKYILYSSISQLPNYAIVGYQSNDLIHWSDLNK
ncbi:MAG: family 43 glycosylhydrolase [Sporolactobacillus sp.]